MIEARVVWSANTPPTHKDNSFPSLCAYIHTALMIILFPPEGTLKRKMSIAIIKGIIGRG